MPTKFTFFLSIIIPIACAAQKIVPHWVPGNLDSLKQQLVSAKDTARVNLMNELSYRYFNIHMDSSLAYATAAGTEAVALQYRKGEVVSLIYLSQWHMVMEEARKAKQFAQQAFEKGALATDLKSFAVACLLLGYLSPKEAGMRLIDKADSLFNVLSDEEGQLDAWATKGNVYLKAGQTYEALQLFNQYKHLSARVGLVEPYANGLQLIGRIYAIIGDYRTSNEHFRESVRYRIRYQQAIMGEYNEMYENYLQLRQFDSALEVINRFISNIEYVIKDPFIKQRILTTAFAKRGAAYLRLGHDRQALSIFLPILNQYQKEKNAGGTMYLLSLTGNAYAAGKNYNNAVACGRELMSLATTRRNPRMRKDAAELLSVSFEAMREPDSAYYYLKLFTVFEDSLAARNLQNNITFFRTMDENQAAAIKIRELDTSNKLKQERLNLLIAGVTGLLLLVMASIGYISIRRKNEANSRLLLENKMDIQRLEAEKQQAFLKQHATELEMQALRAQMNPHFIFNCLNAINHFVLKNETKTASDYLTKFSRLIRLVLQNSANNNISLEDELSTLRLYIELEQLRFKSSFQFVISVDDAIDLETTMIPPLLLQPFVENAIWHGLVHKENGLLNIEILQQQTVLYCAISDNGAGRNNGQGKSSSSFKKSMGMQITSNRLKLMNEAVGGGKFSVLDLVDVNNEPCGTKVIVEIPGIV